MTDNWLLASGFFLTGLCSLVTDNRSLVTGLWLLFHWSQLVTFHQ